MVAVIDGMSVTAVAARNRVSRVRSWVAAPLCGRGDGRPGPCSRSVPAGASRQRSKGRTGVRCLSLEWAGVSQLPALPVGRRVPIRALTDRARRGTVTPIQRCLGRAASRLGEGIRPVVRASDGDSPLESRAPSYVRAHDRCAEVGLVLWCR